MVFFCVCKFCFLLFCSFLFFYSAPFYYFIFYFYFILFIYFFYFLYLFLQRSSPQKRLLPTSPLILTFLTCNKKTRYWCLHPFTARQISPSGACHRWFASAPAACPCVPMAELLGRFAWATSLGRIHSSDLSAAVVHVTVNLLLCMIKWYMRRQTVHIYMCRMH